MKSRIFVGDFETTVYDGQTRTDVWASALVELYTEEVRIVGSIEQQIADLIGFKENIIVYFHNLKFDGSFIIDYLVRSRNFRQAWSNSRQQFIDDKHMSNNTYKYIISEMGTWYSITIKANNCMIQIRDSLKLLPFSVKKLGKDLQTKHRKKTMEYVGFREPNCYISEEEKEYIRNDVLVVKESLEFMFSEGHNKLTIGSCCMSEFKKTMDRDDYKRFFPNLEQVLFDNMSADEYIRNSYRGGWCYVVHGCENKIYKNGVTADVNSLYPSMMSSESGNYYPVGLPNFWSGDYIPDQAQYERRYYFVRVKCQFELKDKMLPFVQIKGDFRYQGNEMLRSSRVYHARTDTYINNQVTLTLTKTDWILFQDHYHIYDCEILDGCWFYAEIGIFDDYIEKYKKIKVESKGAKRMLAKLFLNNLYGKLATSNDSSFKLAYIKPNGLIGFKTIKEKNKKTVYIPTGSAITSYAREFTIRTAQKNFYGADQRGFKYADTDSIHCDLGPHELIDVPVHKTDFCHWNLECEWEQALFVRQKTYVEEVSVEEGEQVTPYLNVKCAGMNQECKNNFLQQIENGEKQLSDFKVGLSVPGKLMPTRIQGGILLKSSNFNIH